jgi:hypothetical protein
MGLVDVEFKVKTAALTWEQTTVYTRHKVKTCVEAGEKAKEIARYEGCEVRWNIAGLGQGHYVQP